MIIPQMKHAEKNTKDKVVVISQIKCARKLAKAEKEENSSSN